MAINRFPPGSIRDRVAQYGDHWMTDGGLMPVGRHLSAEVADEEAINYCMRCTSWPHKSFAEREKYRRGSFLDRAFLGHPVRKPLPWLR
jgi:hypothetical protein